MIEINDIPSVSVAAINELDIGLDQESLENQNINLNSNYLKSKSAYILSRNFFKQPHEIVF